MGRRVTVAGLCDAAEERFFRRARGNEGYAATTRGEMAGQGFFVCDPDLEGERLTALGVETVERVLRREGERELFTRFQQQPAQRRHPTLAQMHRFTGTRSGRKVRLAAAMAQALEPDDVPRPQVPTLPRTARRFLTGSPAVGRRRKSGKQRRADRRREGLVTQHADVQAV